MTLDALLSRARYLAIALPLFALSSTIHAGCSGGTNFYQGRYGGGYRTTGYDDVPGSGSCVVYRTAGGGGGGYFGPCDDDEDDGYAYGGYSGYGP